MSSLPGDSESQEARNAVEARYRRNGTLTDKKLREYIPIMVVNNLSVLLLVSVDGLVLGNLVGKNALAAVNIFYPATTLIGVASVLVGCGTGTSLAVAVGKGDHDALMRPQAPRFARLTRPRVRDRAPSRCLAPRRGPTRSRCRRSTRRRPR